MKRAAWHLRLTLPKIILSRQIANSRKSTVKLHMGGSKPAYPQEENFQTSPHAQLQKWYDPWQEKIHIPMQSLDELNSDPHPAARSPDNLSQLGCPERPLKVKGQNTDINSTALTIRSQPANILQLHTFADLPKGQKSKAFTLSPVLSTGLYSSHNVTPSFTPKTSTPSP